MLRRGRVMKTLIKLLFCRDQCTAAFITRSMWCFSTVGLSGAVILPDPERRASAGRHIEAGRVDRKPKRSS